MKITRIEATPVRMPVAAVPYSTYSAGTKTAWGGRKTRLSPKRPTPMLEYCLVRIDTDEGVSGLGEAQADIGFFGDSVEGVCAGVADYLGPQLIGKNPLDREYIFGIIDYRGNTCARSGIDMALHDLIGKMLNVPVSVLFGGAHDERVEVALEVAGGPPEEMAAWCEVMMGQGVRAFKPKIGGIPEADAERLCAIREAVGPDVCLRADANQGYTQKEAILLCRLLSDTNVDLEVLEQPVPAWDLVGMAAVRRAVHIPIEADESCYSVHDAIRIVRQEAADVINIKLSKAGGLYNAKKIAAIAESAGLGCVIGTAFGLGLEIAAKLHFAASTQIVHSAVEFTELALHRNLLAGPHDGLLALPLVDGCLRVPSGPGLGVQLDNESVAQCLVSQETSATSAGSGIAAAAPNLQ